ncbi:hypothetical protein ABPG73_002303 [Tetrahymena malaccensis]
MIRQKSSENNFRLPKDKLPECNLFTLFLRKQTQASSELNFDRKKIMNKEANKTPHQTNRKQLSGPKYVSHQSMTSITPERNASKKKQIVYSNMKNLKKTPYHHLSVNIIDTAETSDSNSKSFQKHSFQKSRKPSLTIKDLNQSQINQSHAAQTITQRSQASSQCKTRKSSISADLAHRHTQRSSFIQGINNVNLSQNRTTRTEQSQERSNSKFKAKKMPNFQVPFIVYKSNKPLTTFQEFNLATRQRSSSGQHTNNTNDIKINNVSNTTSIKKSHNTSINVHGKENKEQNTFSSVIRPQSSQSKSSNRTYLNENINYQNMQNYITQQQEFVEQQNQCSQYQKFFSNFHTLQQQQASNSNKNSQRTQVSNRINSSSNQSSSLKDKQFTLQMLKHSNNKQYF